MEQTFINMAPHLMAFASLLLGGAFFKFVLDILKWNKGNRAQRSAYDRLYEIAYRKSDFHGRHIAQLGVAIISAHLDKDAVRTAAFIEIFRDSLFVETSEGKSKMAAYPDFLKEAREEIRLLEEKEGAANEPNA